MEHWYLVSEDRLRLTLMHARAGQSPDVLLMQLWANSDHVDEGTDESAEVGVAEVATFSFAVEGEE